MHRDWQPSASYVSARIIRQRVSPAQDLLDAPVAPVRSESMVKRSLLVGALLAVTALGPTAAWSQSQPVADVLVSRQLAETENLHVGETIVLSADPSGAEGRRFRVAGIYEPTPDPMRLALPRIEARLHLPDLISLTTPPSDIAAADSVTSITIALRDPASADQFMREVLSAVPIQALAVRPTQGGAGTASLFVVLDRFHTAIAVVTIVASTTFLLALMVMLVDERRQAVGILRLIGFRRRRVLLQVLVEGLLVAFAGALFGILLAAGLQNAVNAFFQWRYDTTLVFVRITPQIALQCSLIAVPMGMLASLLSSWTLLRSGVLELARR